MFKNLLFTRRESLKPVLIVPELDSRQTNSCKETLQSIAATRKKLANMPPMKVLNYLSNLNYKWLDKEHHILTAQEKLQIRSLIAMQKANSYNQCTFNFKKMMIMHDNASNMSFVHPFIPIGKGTRGKVFLIFELNTGNTFVLKTSNQSSSTSLSAEHKKLQRHKLAYGPLFYLPFDDDVNELSPALIMKLITGESLSKQYYTRLNESENIEQKACFAVRKVHQMGDIHADAHLDNCVLDLETNEPVMIDYATAMPYNRLGIGLKTLKGRRIVTVFDDVAYMLDSILALYQNDTSKETVIQRLKVKVALLKKESERCVHQGVILNSETKKFVVVDGKAASNDERDLLMKLIDSIIE